MAQLRELDSNAEFGAPHDWTVVYAVAISKPGLLKEVMPLLARRVADARTGEQRQWDQGRGRDDRAEEAGGRHSAG